MMEGTRQVWDHSVNSIGLRSSCLQGIKKGVELTSAAAFTCGVVCTFVSWLYTGCVVQVVDIQKLKKHHRDFIVNRALGSAVDQDNEVAVLPLSMKIVIV